MAFFSSRHWRPEVAFLPMCQTCSIKSAMSIFSKDHVFCLIIISSYEYYQIIISSNHQIVKSSNHQRFECEQTCSLHLNVKIIGCLNCQKQLSCCNSGGHFGRVSSLTTGWASSRSFARIRSSGSCMHFRWWKKLICWICLGETTKETRKISRIRWELQNLTWMIQSFQENSIC